MDLIKIEHSKVGEDHIPTVNARELYDFFESKQDFSDWIKNRIDDYGFIEEKDFTIILRKSTGGRPTKEYHISTGMGKEISMIERSEKCKKARRYFIECEKKAIGIALEGEAPLITQMELFH